jgi:hypothetical protein
MTKDVDNWIQHYGRCLKRKKEHNKKSPININSFQPTELVCLDFITIDSSNAGMQNTPIIKDLFRSFAYKEPHAVQRLKHF